MFALTALVAPIPFVFLFHAANNTLARNGHWTSTKSTAALHLMSSWEFENKTPALARNRLNLSAWHGFQEVRHREIINPEEVRFRFYLEELAYMAVLFYDGGGGFYGVRFSLDPLLDTAYVAGTKSGEFLEKQPVPLEDLREGAWNRCRMKWTSSGLAVSLNDGTQRILPAHRDGPRRIGFRGGFRGAYVDNVEAVGKDGRLAVSETFDNLGGAWTTYGLYLAGLVSVALLTGRPLLELWNERQRPLPLLTALNLCIGAFGAAVFPMQFYHFSGAYPTERDVQETNEQYIREDTARIIDEISIRYASPAPADTARVLVVGSSQTWGAGASELTDDFVSVLERGLNVPGGTTARVQCINAGIRGLESGPLVALHERHWLGLSPDLVIINLSHNDAVGEPFRENLIRFVDLNEAAGIQTLFVLEAVSGEKYSGRIPAHDAMESVAEDRGVPIVDMNAYFRERRDDGFLWWDFIHMTTFGYRLLGERLVDPVKLLLSRRGEEEARAAARLD